jgi:hypothetical protein
VQLLLSLLQLCYYYCNFSHVAIVAGGVLQAQGLVLTLALLLRQYRIWKTEDQTVNATSPSPLIHAGQQYVMRRHLFVSCA